MKSATILKSSIAIGIAVGLLLVSEGFAKTPPKRPTEDATAVLMGSATTLLPDGQILISGGQSRSGKVSSGLSIQDRLSGSTTKLTVTLNFARAGHTATVLPDGTVLILGGIGADGRVVGSAEIFDPI